MQHKHYDLIVIGAGVLGSFHAYHACKKGRSVLLLEKDIRPMEATVRNFGQIVASGMSQGRWQEYGRKSIEIYNELQNKFDISVRKDGTVYIASDETELTLIQELADINSKNQYNSILLSQEACIQRYPGLKSDYCKAGLFFPDEITVEPHLMIHRLIAFMQEQMNLVYSPGTLISFCDHINGRCIAEDSFGNAYTSDRIVICNGRDFKNLFPSTFYDGDIEVSKLQMMKTVQMKNYSLKGAVLSGLSIRRYESFQECPSFEKLKAADIEDRFKQWGIHVLFKQAIDGSIIIGDSHEYADAREQGKLGFEVNHSINQIVLEEAKRIFNFPCWEIASTWNGYYAQCKKEDLFKKEVAPNIHVVTAIGGKGMTASAGLSAETIQQII